MLRYAAEDDIPFFQHMLGIADRHLIEGSAGPAGKHDLLFAWCMQKTGHRFSCRLISVIHHGAELVIAPVRIGSHLCVITCDRINDTLRLQCRCRIVKVNERMIHHRA